MCSPAWRAILAPNDLRRSRMTAPSILAAALSSPHCAGSTGEAIDRLLSAPARSRGRCSV